MTQTIQGLQVLMQPCNSGMCPALYADASGRIFVQGQKIDRSQHSGLIVPAHEDVVEITPELLSYLKTR